MVIWTATCTWFRILVKHISKPQFGGELEYEWLKLNIFTRWNASTKEHIVIVFDPKRDVQKKITDQLFDPNITISSEDPHSIYVPLAQLAVEFQEDAVWTIRDAVRLVETSRRITSLLPQPSPQDHFCRLHDLARHAIHVSETLDLTNQTLSRIFEYLDRFANRSAISQATKEDVKDRAGNQIVKIALQNQNAHDHLRFYQDAIQALRLRSTANKDRLQNEIQYSFNLVAQDIARTSNEIQNAVQVDSSIMKTVALVTAAFIPMTFVTSVFGMQFFVYNVDDGSWNMSDKFWIFWVMGIPFTFMTAFLTYWYYRVSPSERRYFS